MLDPQNEIKFYDRGNTYGRSSGKDYYEFTNFFPVSFNISEIPQSLNLSSHLIGKWKTSEHLFQAAKFTDSDIIEEIRQVPDTEFRSAGGVFWLANSDNGKYKSKIREGWHSIKVEVMRWAVKEKFVQNEQLKEILVETGNAKLIEDSPTDYFWGIGANGSGHNELGKILEKLRDELAAKQSSDSNPPPKKQPTSSSQSTTPDNNPNSSDQNNNKNNNNKSPNSNQKEGNNPPTNNNNPTQTPTSNNNDSLDKENNDNSPPQNSDNLSPSEPTTGTPPINIDRINKAETPKEAWQYAQQQIQELFAKSKVKPSDLDNNLWKSESGWEEYLKKLKTNQEVADFAQEMEKKIREKQQAKQNRDSSSLKNSNSPNGNKILTWSVGGGVFLVVIVSAVLIFRWKNVKHFRRRNAKRSKKAKRSIVKD